MLSRVVDDLRSSKRYGLHVTASYCVPSQAACYGDWPEGLDVRVKKASCRQNIERPWIHQAQAIEAVLKGNNVVIVTPTASGKTLCYNAPVLHTMLVDPLARALYLFPTKALAHDQLDELKNWADILGLELSAATYDGDTSTAARSAIRQNSRVVISNPDMLHVGILPHHANWSSLFQNLKFIVLDEIHTYRGIFGSHVVNVLRRLKRIARFYGSNPQFICCSATIANPKELTEDLIGAPVTVIDSDGSPKGERYLIFYNPPIVNKELGLRRSAILETEQLAMHFIKAGVQTIIFTRTRLTTELLLKYLQSAMGKGEDNRCELSIRGYRGGYRPGERRAIEQGLRDGTIRGVVSTTALELGIDIGQLDACLMAGYPNTIAGTWQQMGRAGRRGSVSVAVLVAGAGPLDQYIVTHPRYFLEQSPEHALVNPDNLLILLDHIRCAAFELPFHKGDAFGQEKQESIDLTNGLLQYLTENGEIHLAGDTYYWMAEHYPAERIGLRSTGASNIVIVEASDPDHTSVLGTIERSVAPLMVHQGAIYMHDGASFHVDRLDWQSGHAFVHPVEADYYTTASYRVEIKPVSVEKEKDEGGARVFYGEIEVKGKATGFRKVRLYTHETLGWGDIDLPEQTINTTGYWFTLNDKVVDRLREAGFWDFDPTGYRGPNWKEQREKIRARDGYKCRHCGAPEKPHRQHDIHHLISFRDFGYIPGENMAYKEANQLDNLITLCQGCHRKAEGAQRFQGALTGLAHVLGQVAPLFLMCDQRDIGIQSEAQAPGTRKPTLTIYEKIPAGVGFGTLLFYLHSKLLTMAHELIESCGCASGCPSCIGPVDEVGKDAKAYTLAVIKELR